MRSLILIFFSCFLLSCSTYYKVELNGENVYVDKLNGEILEIYEVRYSPIKDSEGTWNNLRGPFYTTKNINFYECEY
jgi:hypothetical protein